MTTLSAPQETVARTDPGRVSRRQRRLGDRILFAYTWLIILWLAAPIAVMILFGFNDTQSRFNQTFQGFTLKWYGRLFEIPALTEALVNSLIIAIASSLLSCVIGTLVGVALGRYRFRGDGTTNFIMFATISSPELVTGAA